MVGGEELHRMDTSVFIEGGRDILVPEGSINKKISTTNAYEVAPCAHGGASEGKIPFQLPG